MGARDVVLIRWLTRLRMSFWLVPVLLLLASGGLAAGALTLDSVVQIDKEHETLAWLRIGGPEAARSLLAAMATSMITVAGVAFSITIAVLVLASSQFGPRLLHNFIRDRGNQVVLGSLTGTFLYCLLVLLTIGLGGSGPVPSISVLLGALLGVVDVVVLIYFLQHVASSIHADHVVAEVGQELDEVVENLWVCPDRADDEHDEGAQGPPALPDDFDREAAGLEGRSSGYLTALDLDRLLRLATRHDLLVCLDHAPGQYVIAGDVVMRVYPGGRAAEPLRRRLLACAYYGRTRTPEQDVEYALSQLVELALRAMSPGINDPFTAVRCVDRLGAGLCRLARRVPPSRQRFDDRGALRLVVPWPAFGDVVGSAFDMVREVAPRSTALTLKLLDVIAVVAPHVHRTADLLPLRSQAEMILRAAEAGVPEELDRQRVRQRFDLAAHAMRERLEGHLGAQEAALAPPLSRSAA